MRRLPKALVVSSVPPTLYVISSSTALGAMLHSTPGTRVSKHHRELLRKCMAQSSQDQAHWQTLGLATQHLCQAWELRTCESHHGEDLAHEARAQAHGRLAEGGHVVAHALQPQAAEFIISLT